MKTRNFDFSNFSTRKKKKERDQNQENRNPCIPVKYNAYFATS